MELIRYGSAGLAGTGVHYIALIVLLESTSATMVFASTLGAVMGAVVNYFVNYFFTFQSTRAHRWAFANFWAVAALGWIINAAMLLFTLRILGAPPIPAQLLATAAAFFATFHFNRKGTF